MQIPVFKGVMTPVATPFDRDGAVDLPALGSHLKFLLANGIETIIPCGTTGEYYALSLVERKRILEFVAEQVGARAQLVAGINSPRPDETMELGRHAERLGYRILMLAAPPSSLPTTEELATHCRSIAECFPSLPVILYNLPSRAGVDMNRAFLEAVSDATNICAVKESSGSFARMLEQVIYFDDRYQRICGADDQAVDFFLWGSKSWIAGASNCLPAEHVAVYEACVVQKDFILGQRLMRAMMPLIYLLEQGGKYIQFVKYGCELAGSPIGGARPPLLTLSSEEKAEFRRLHEAMRAEIQQPSSRKQVMDPVTP